MRNKLGTICMILGAVLILAALSLFIWNQIEAQKAGDSSDKILSQMKQCIENPTEGDDDETTEIRVDGYNCIGYLSIPALELELPVLSEWDYERLKVAPCRYTGSVKTNDLVIAAHNYVRHFKALSKLSAGDTVTFTDIKGVIFAYKVAAVDILPSDAVEEMITGDFDLTLFTCTYGNANRVTVRCERAAD